MNPAYPDYHKPSWFTSVWKIEDISLATLAAWRIETAECERHNLAVYNELRAKYPPQKRGRSTKAFVAPPPKFNFREFVMNRVEDEKLKNPSIHESVCKKFFDDEKNSNLI